MPDTVTDSDRLDSLAQEQFDAAAAAEKRGDRFELAAVFFALTLFFGGIATMFAARQVVVTMLGVSMVVLVVGSFTLVAAL